MVQNEEKVHVLEQKNKNLTSKIAELEVFSEEREKELESFKEVAQQFNIMLEDKQKKYKEQLTLLQEELR